MSREMQNKSKKTPKKREKKRRGSDMVRKLQL